MIKIYKKIKNTKRKQGKQQGKRGILDTFGVRYRIYQHSATLGQQPLRLPLPVTLNLNLVEKKDKFSVDGKLENGG